jgi:hypothetical protein
LSLWIPGGPPAVIVEVKGHLQAYISLIIDLNNSSEIYLLPKGGLLTSKSLACTTMDASVTIK